jgi:hypothetical protein
MFGAVLVSTPCFATTEDEDISRPMQFALVPSIGIHVGMSQLKGSNGVSPGLSGGLGFRFFRDGYFFTPMARLIAVVGLDQSPAEMWTIGFIAGGHLKSANLDLFVGVDSASFISYKVGSSPLGKIGAIFNLGFSDAQFILDAFYASFVQNVVLSTTATNQITYSYAGIEAAFQFPIDL